MQEKKDIRLFYITNLLSSCLGGIGGLLMLALLSQEQYGLYTLYTTFVLQFMILAFGYPDGILIDYRHDNGDVNLANINKDLQFIIKLQFLILITSLIIFNLLNTWLFHFDTSLTIIINIALTTMFPSLLIDNFRAIYISLKDFNNVAKIDAFIKSYLILMVIPIIIFAHNKNMIYIFMLFDLLCKALFFAYLYYNFHHKYGKLIKNYQLDPHHHSTSHFKTGLFLLIGNWLVILIYSLDKMFLSNNQEALGIYTQALFFFGIIYQIVMPFKDVIFVKINEKMSNKDIFSFALYMLIGVFILVCIFSYVIIPSATYICNMIIHFETQIDGISYLANKVLDYSEALSISQLVIVMIPTYITVQLVLDNLLMIKMQSRYAFKTLINFIISLLIYVFCINIIPNPLIAVVDATIIMSVILYFNNLLSVTNFKCAIIGLGFICMILLLYYLGLKFVILKFVLVFILVFSFFYLKGKINNSSLQR